MRAALRANRFHRALPDPTGAPRWPPSRPASAAWRLAATAPALQGESTRCAMPPEVSLRPRAPAPATAKI